MAVGMLLGVASGGYGRGGEVQFVGVSEPRDVEGIQQRFRSVVSWPDDAETAASTMSRKQAALMASRLAKRLGKILRKEWLPEDIESNLRGARAFQDGFDTMFLAYDLRGYGFQVKATSYGTIIRMASQAFRRQVDDPVAFVQNDVAGVLLHDTLLDYSKMYVVQVADDLVRILIAPAPGTVEQEAKALRKPEIWISEGVVVLDYTMESQLGYPFENFHGVKEWFNIEEDIRRMEDEKTEVLIGYITADSVDRGMMEKRGQAFEIALRRPDPEHLVAPLIEAYRRARIDQTRLFIAQALQRLHALVDTEAASRIARFLKENAQEAKGILRGILMRDLTDRRAASVSAAAKPAVDTTKGRPSQRDAESGAPASSEVKHAAEPSPSAASGSVAPGPPTAPEELDSDKAVAETPSGDAIALAGTPGEAKEPPSADSRAWIYLLVGLAAGLSIAAAVTWRLLRRRRAA